MIRILAKHTFDEYNNVSVRVVSLANEKRDLLKTLMAIQEKLENLYKTKETLDNEIIDCINLCRTKLLNPVDKQIDPPLSYKN